MDLRGHGKSITENDLDLSIEVMFSTKLSDLVVKYSLLSTGIWQILRI